MTMLELDLSFLFVIAVILIWFMIAYQFVLTAFGYIDFLKSLKEKREVDGGTFAAEFTQVHGALSWTVSRSRSPWRISTIFKASCSMVETSSSTRR